MWRQLYRPCQRLTADSSRKLLLWYRTLTRRSKHVPDGGGNVSNVRHWPNETLARLRTFVTGNDGNPRLPLYRTLLWLGLFFAAGIGVARLPWYWMLIAAAWCRKPLLVAAFAAGLFYATSYEWGYRPTLEAFAGQEVVVQGKVTAEPVWKNGAWRFRLDSTGGESMMVKVKQSREEAFYYGDLLEVSAVLEKPSPPRNPGAFDAKAFYERQGIHYALTAKSVRKLGRDDRGLHGRLFVPIRKRLLEVVDQQFPGEQGAVIAGLLLGITAEIEEETMESFRVMGVVHILAVSGANVAMILLPFLALLNRLRIAERRRYLLGIFVVLLYGGLTGGGPSVVRACTMAVVWCISRIVSRESDLLTSWALAGWIALLLNPLTLYDPGFQLTMLITMGLLLLPERLRFLFKMMPDKLATLLAVTLTAELLSVPIVLTLNPAFTPLSLLANLLIVPLLTLLVPLSVCTILLGLIHAGAAALPACVARLLLDALILPLQYTGQARWLVRHYQAPPIWWLFGYYAWWWVYSVRPVKWRQIALTFFASFLLVGLIRWEQPLRITFLDVGQGDSALIQTPNGKVWLIDSGGIPGFLNSTFDIGKRIVVPALASYGIDHIDVLVLTHADEDHIRGTTAVMEHFTIGQVLVANAADPSPFFQSLLQEIHRRHIPLLEPRAGQTVALDDNLKIVFWNPPPKTSRANQHSDLTDTNAGSIVFSLHAGHHTFLFTGDAEQVTTTLSHVDVLKVAHHGSKNETVLPFTLDHALLSVGAKNRYGHPALSTVEQLHQKQATIWRTDRHGAVEAVLDGDILRIKTWLPAQDTK
ncbi:DNA internalization-related competence protein ComEC/Rec2 [Tumebacillus algifaecis]|uniref:DNA internalization-related competence protein ComEC/Rec2 n=1 Tax=Tumebacillus algifaecis TaxID=1214604 RepID=A0A223D075_9BACL|nr:DNA internalization-related competence protein ComEC/Rec2 [Tumebacillus algifaecis]ASS74767.1 DNA internalization-related competence protein ComEC/Rec2 [Tumebacillus algifaecis]